MHRYWQSGQTETIISPCPCSWGRRSGQREGRCQRPASSGSRSAGKTAGGRGSIWARVQSCVKYLRNTSVSELAYSPRFVTEVVDGVQRVDGGDSGVLQTNNQVPEVLVLGHAVGVLAHQDEIRPERPGGIKERESPGHQRIWGVWDLLLFIPMIEDKFWFGLRRPQPPGSRLICSCNQGQLVLVQSPTGTCMYCSRPALFHPGSEMFQEDNGTSARHPGEMQEW